MATETSLPRQISDNFRAVAESLQEATPEWSWSVQLMSDYFRRVDEAQAEGKPVGAINFGIPSEILWAMDIVPLLIDPIGGVAAAFPEGVAKYIDLAEQHVPSYICANNKTFIGMLLSGDLRLPKFIMHPSVPCDSNMATYPVMAEYFGCSYFCIDVPYVRSESGLTHVAGEMRKLIGFLEEQTGRKLDLDRLRQAMEYSNQAHEYMLKLAQLRQNVPCPYSSLDAISEYGLVLMLCGTPQLVDYFKKKYQVTTDKVARKEGYLPHGAEKLRLVWIYGAPAFDFTILLWLEKQYGALSVAFMNNNFVMKPVPDISTLDKMLMGLARKTVLMPMSRECGGVWENYLDAQIDLLRRFKADAAIFGGHVACKSNWAMAKLVKDRIWDELGIPTLNFELDIFDPRVTSAEDIKSTIGRFLDEVPVRQPRRERA
jgi:benzoyl-CoA reductase subunit B